MASEALEAKFKTIVAAVADLLKREGFKGSGGKFRRQRDDNLQLIEFQRSVSNDQDCIQFTANVGIISSKILRALDPEADIQRQGASSAHVRQRLGYFRDQPTDHWWQLAANSDEAVVAGEIAQLLTGRVLPFLSEHASDEGLVKLWRSGRSPGLTEFQRNRNLAALS